MARKKSPNRNDAPATTERAVNLEQNSQVQYWIVLSFADILSLDAGVVSKAVIAQCRQHLHRDRTESREAYLLRLSETQE